MCVHPLDPCLSQPLVGPSAPHACSPSGPVQVAPAAAKLAPLLRATKVDAYAFVAEADFRTLRHADEATYDAAGWALRYPLSRPNSSFGT